MNNKNKILLNPGSNYILNAMDCVYYIGLTNEESLNDFYKKQNESQKLTSNFTGTLY